MNDVVSRVNELILPICAAQNVELVDVEYVQEAGTYFLRVFVDTNDGLTMDECVSVSEAVSLRLDELDFIEEEYMLEVSSPGAERPLKTREALKDAIDCYINVSLHEEVEGRIELEGFLREVSNDDELMLEVMFKTRKKEVRVEYSNVMKARLAVKF